MVATRLKDRLCKYTDHLLLFLLPVALILINSNWIFTPVKLSPDPWFYFSNFRYFFKFATEFPSNTHYFIERLTWNLPGYLVYHIFAPEIANYVLHLLVYYVAVFSLYHILKILFNQRSALISSLVLGSYPWFLRAVGWDYVDGVGTAYFLLLLFLLLRAACSTHWKKYLLIAGIVHSSLLITNLSWLGFTPAWAVFFIWEYFQHHKFNLKQLILMGCAFVAGNLLLVIALGIFYYQVTGNFFFLKTSILSSLYLGSNPTNKQNVLEFYGKMPAFWHLLPALLATIAARQLLTLKNSKYHQSFVVAAITFSVFYSCLIILNYLSIPYLLVYLYCSFLIPATFLLFGAIFASPLDRLSERSYRLLVGGTLVIFSLPFLFSRLYPSLIGFQGKPWIIAVFSLAVFIGFLGLRFNQVLIPIFLGLSALFFLGATTIEVFVADPNLNKNNFLVLNDAIQTIDEYYPGRQYSDFRLWYKSEENLITSLPLSSVYLYPWGSTIDVYATGEIKWPATAPLSNGEVILVTAGSDPQIILNEANLALKPKGGHLSYETSKHFTREEASLTLVFTSLKAPPLTLEYGEKFEFDRYPAEWRNWYAPENSGRTYMWSGPESTSELWVDFPSLKSQDKVEICILTSMAPEMLEDFQFYVNHQEVKVTKRSSEDCPYMYSGSLSPQNINPDQDSVSLRFRINKTVRPIDLKINNDGRPLGLAFDWIRFTEEQ